MATKMSKEEQKWRAEDDARALANAAAIQSDKKRMAAASGAAKRLAPETTDRAKRAATEARQMNKLAGKKATPTRTSKPAAKRAAPKRRRK